MKHYLIDSENVGDFWIPLLDLPADMAKLIVFYTKNSPHMSYDSLIKLKESDRKVTFIKCYEGTNALDFQLCTELGFLIAGNPGDEFIIVTNDTGYDAAVKYWRRKEYSVKRIAGKDSRTGSRRRGTPARADVAAEVSAILHKLMKTPGADAAGAEAYTEEETLPHGTEESAEYTHEQPEPDYEEEDDLIDESGEDEEEASSEEDFVSCDDSDDDDSDEGDFADEDDSDDDDSDDDDSDDDDSDDDDSDEDDSDDDSDEGDFADDDSDDDDSDDDSDDDDSDDDDSDEISADHEEEKEESDSEPGDHEPDAAFEKTEDAEADGSGEEPEEEADREAEEEPEENASDSLTDGAGENAAGSKRQAQEKEEEQAFDEDIIEQSEEFVPDPEEITAIVNCIGMDNLAELHNQLIQFYGDNGKDVYLSLKSGALSIEKKDWDKEEKFLYYCALIFRHSDEPAEALTEENISEFAAFLLGAENKRKNLNSLRYALLKHYGKEKGRRYYFMLKPYVKALNQM